MVSLIETITPERANELLERNRCGRSIDEDILRLLTNTMRGGRWTIRAQAMPILLDREGYLVYGQTMLKALVGADRTLEMVVRRGV